ncbi:MAG: hypothetical protein IMZ43_02490 [Thermoplasmata archaeon]|nr:hypothetical protein [Thermoplasmata archaeon]MBE3136251.1 hypothetical protein [Thermoplasmata archaeon]MBE3140064.1 hypothetical protein [Thermoplasmata archaeon]
MKLGKSSIVLIGVSGLLLLTLPVSATSINDGTGDVYHWTNTGTAWSWRANIGDKPNVDITEVSYSIDGNKLTLKLEVAGTIQTSEYYWYNVYFNSSDTIYYWMWSNGSGLGAATNQGQQAFDFVQNFTVSGNSISAEFNVIGNTSTGVELWGQAHQYTTAGANQQTTEWWGDWAPNTHFTGQVTGDDTGNDDNTGDKPKPSTPGFEAIAVIAAVGLALILLKRRK